MTTTILEKAKNLHNRLGKNIIAGRNAWASIVTADFESFLFQNCEQAYQRPAAAKPIIDWEIWALSGEASEQKPLYRH